jgi:hypothetical protein
VKQLKGPELKLSQLKVPDVLKDLYWDLHDRRLLPLVGLAVVAILAVPFLLGSGSKGSPESRGGGGVPVAGAGAGEVASLTVVPAEPGLREPSKRLAGRRSTDPFQQHYTGPILSPGAQPAPESSTPAGGTTTTTESSSSSETVVTSPPSSPSTGSGEAGGGGENGGGLVPGSNNPNLKLYTWTIKVQISRTETAADGSVKMGEPTLHQSVKPLTPLPGEKTPVVTSLGVNPSTGNVLLMVSKEVTALFGDAKCVSGTSSCELVEVEKGFPETFEYGPGHVRYKFKIINIDLVRIAKP